MNYYCIKKFEDFLTFLACNDWFMLLKEVKEEFLVLVKIAELRQGVGEESTVKVASYLLMYKYKFEIDCINMQAAKCWRKCMLN